MLMVAGVVGDLVDRAIITWDPDLVRLSAVAASRHPLLRSSGYFVVLAAKLDEAADLWHDLEMIYIGGAFDTSLRRGVEGAQASGKLDGAQDDLKGRELLVMLGEQTEATLKRVTRGFTDDVATCLVERHRTALNPQLTGPYEGRKISVINRGDYPPLMPKCLLRPQIA